MKRTHNAQWCSYSESAKLCEDVGTSIVVDGRYGLSLFDLLTSTFGVCRFRFCDNQRIGYLHGILFTIWLALYEDNYILRITNYLCIHGNTYMYYLVRYIHIYTIVWGWMELKTNMWLTFIALRARWAFSFRSGRFLVQT